MSKTIVGLFDRPEDAERAVRELYSSGFSHDDVSIVANNSEGAYSAGSPDAVDQEQAADSAGGGAVGGTVLGGGLGLLVGLGMLAIPGIGPVAAAGTLATVLGSTALGAGLGAATGGVIGALVGAGVPEEEASFYAEGVRRGGTLVTVSTQDERVDDAVAALEASGPVNVEQREAYLRQSGWQGFDPQSKPLSAEEISQYRSASSTDRAVGQASSARGADAVLPVIQEDLQVGKREVQRGGVRVHSRVVEQPVEEQVRLREERVNIERRPVNRELSPNDTAAFQEQQFEVRETSEEAVVNKQARVVEEVVVHKEAVDRTETVRDTVRRTDVDVEKLGNPGTTSSDYSTYENDFRSHYQQGYANSGYSYEQYMPVYNYGYTLASDERYHGRDWDTVEADARKGWEQSNPGTWEQFKDSVRYAWEKVRGRRH